MNSFKGKRVLVLGGGISGVGVAKVLARRKAHVLLSDAKETTAIKNSREELLASGVELIIGPQVESILSEVNIMVLSPGISLFASLPQLAINKGIEVISEIEVAYRICKVPIIAITGTNGKTTTTALLGELLRESGYNTVVGGNIGAALSLEVASMSNADVVVAEISSYQLEASRQFSPAIAVILNITPDHLERHKTMDEYIRSKSKIFARQTAKNYLVLNHDDATLHELARVVKSRVIWFSCNEILSQGIFVRDGKIILAIEDVTIDLMPVDELKLIGQHNIYNVLAAVACAYIYGANLTAMRRALRGFSGVEHRIEFVRDYQGVVYYNDSKATNPESTIPALKAFDKPLVLLAGGRDKNTSLNEMMHLVAEKKVKLVLFGEAAERFGAAAREQGIDNAVIVSDMKSALLCARQSVVPGGVVLLSPACASYDQYDNFEQRGQHFKQMVNELE